MKIKIAVVQMDCVLWEKETNISKAVRFVKEAIQKSAQIIVLPELFSTGYRLDELEIHIDAISSGNHVLFVDDVIATG